MPPEIVNEKFYTNKVDIWGLGVLLFEMIHGKAPFVANCFEDIKREINHKNVVVYKECSQDTRDLIFCLLRTNLEERFDIDSLLKHPALVRNLEHFERPLTKNEYDVLLTNFYFSEYRVRPEDLKTSNIMEEGKVEGELSGNGFPEEKKGFNDERIVSEKKIVKIKVFKGDKEQFVDVKIDRNLIDIDEKMIGINKLVKNEYPVVKRRLSLNVLEDIKKLQKNNKDYAMINFSKNNFLKKTIVQLALESRFSIHPSGRILLLERKCDWETNFYFEEKKSGLKGKIFFIIFFDDILKAYIINAIRVKEEKNSVRKLIGKIYRGKKKEELKKLSNLEDFITCHRSGLFATTKSLHSAILVADLSFG